MSDSKKTSSPYVVHENRSLDQWKVTELKEELKRRKLLTKGLKEDLVKRLDEAIRAEMEELNQNHQNGGGGVYNNVDHPEVPVPSDDAIADLVVSDKTMNDSIDKNESIEEDKKESLDQDNITEKLDKDVGLQKDKVTVNLDGENRADNRDMPVEIDRVRKELVSEGEQASVSSTGTQGFQVIQEVSVETSVIVGEVMVTQNDEINKDEVSNLQESKPKEEEEEEEAEPKSSDIGSQVVEVSQVKSDSISIVSITEKNELKDNVITDHVKLELDVSKTEPVVVDEPHQKDDVLKIAETETINVSNKNHTSLDVGSPEKLNLDDDDDDDDDDDTMEEDALESKQIDSQDISEKTQAPPMPLLVDVMVEDKNTQSDPTAVVSTKRKQYDHEAVANSEVLKRQRRWNSDKATEQQNINPSVSTTPKGMFQTSMKQSFLRSDSSVSHAEPKERIVPASLKPATTSLRIDRFLRPFTLKAVQELLGKTGTVVSFWMDHIKTHCYVTYSSVEEAVETRNAVYNLQWPANGGRLLMAEFVDPSEVKTRTEPPLPSPPTPITTAPTLPQPPPAATQRHLPPPPPLPLPPPPPLSLPPQSREPLQHLPPPPQLPEKLEPPIMTLDDLFRKTLATPRIYYLPLSDEQVAGKLKAQGKRVVRV